MPPGSVAYTYRIGKYEIPELVINRANAIGNLGLTVTDWGQDYPAGKLGFIEQLILVNWLNVMSGHSPAYRFTESGEWRLWSVEDAWDWGGVNLYRHKDAVYFLPSQDEWHKAAYWDPVARRYWEYPTGSNSPPVPVASGTQPGTAIYQQFVSQGPARVFEAGGLSPFGTMGQGGNIHEVLESAYDGVNDSTNELLMLRGGWWVRPAGNLRSSNVDPGLIQWLQEVPGAIAGEGGSQESGMRLASIVPPVGDSDGDGVDDREELIGGTNPRDAEDFLRLEAEAAEGGVVVRFQALAAPRYGYNDPRRYYVLEGTRDVSLSTWLPVGGYERILGNDQVVTYSLPTDPKGLRVFRLRVWLEAGTMPQPVRGEVTADDFGSGEDSFSIEFVTVSDPGNPHNLSVTTYPQGGVDYVYRMGKFEVSEGMVNKANSLGGLQITLSALGPKKPATMMNFVERARFVNWLNTSKGYPPAYRFGPSGAWELWPPEEAWQEGGLNLFRHKDAFYFLPSADEWYKAAYFDGTHYYLYPSGSDQKPIAVAEGTVGGTIVYGQGPMGLAADVDNAGGLSHYGTMGQGGNVSEWIESAADGFNDSTVELIQLRGGAWDTSLAGLSSVGGGSSGTPGSGTGPRGGFRVAARVAGGEAGVPEAPR